MDRRLLDYLPPILREVRELKAVTGAQEGEIAGLWEAWARLLSELFVESADEAGLSRWEKLLSLSTAGQGTEERRFQIKSVLNNRLPYTERGLRRRLDQMCGEYGYRLETDAAKCRLKLRVTLESQANYQAVKRMLTEMLPAHLETDISLIYNTHGTLAAYTHRQLGEFTHRELRVRRMPAYQPHDRLEGMTHEELSGYTYDAIAKGEF